MKTWLSFCLTGALAVSPLSMAKGQSRFYAGKTIDIIVPYSPGGYYDIGARLVSRHLGEHIPGKPRVIVESQPSAGGIGLAKRFVAGQDNDGTVLGVLQRSAPQYAIVGYQTAAFDPSKLTWIGSVSNYKSDAYVLFLDADDPVKNIDQIRTTTAPVRIGAGRAGSANLIYALIAKQALHFKLNIVRGYAGSAPLFLAEQGHEVDGFFADLSDVKVGMAQQWRTRRIIPIVQFGRKDRLPEIKNTPTADELIKDERERALLEFAEMPFGIALPFAGPAGIPKDRVEILRRAFDEMGKDPKFVADAERMHFESSPVSGEAVAANVEASVRAPAAVKAQFKSLISQ